MTPDPSFDTVQLHSFLEHFRAGDSRATDAFLRRVCGRLERLARGMLHKFPNVRRWADTDDVLQGALVRLLHTLRATQPESTRHFANLAALHIRRELLDLARHFRNRLDQSKGAGHAGREAAAEVPDPVGDLDLWAAFHEQVDRLPVEEREVVGLTFYHGWTQAQIAELFGVDERTVRRRWRAAATNPGGGSRRGAGEKRTGKETSVFRGHVACVEGVAFSPDGQSLAACGSDPLREDGEIMVWDTRTGKDVFSHRTPYRIWGIAFSPDGKQLAGPCVDEAVRVWESRSGRDVCSLWGHAGRVTDAAFSPDGHLLASGGWDGVVRVWDARPVEIGRDPGGTRNPPAPKRWPESGSRPAPSGTPPGLGTTSDGGYTARGRNP
jgi:RNA polymerase sigma factor (sigma-70 family)